MAFIAGAGSIITLLCAAWGIVALGFYNEITGNKITFFELTYYMAPVGWLMVFMLWGLMMVLFKPEKSSIVGLSEKAGQLSREMGHITRNEITGSIILALIVFLSLQSFIPSLTLSSRPGSVSRSKIILATVCITLQSGYLSSVIRSFRSS